MAMRELPASRAPFRIGAVLAMSLEMLRRSFVRLIGLSLLPWVLGYGLLVAGVYAALRLHPAGVTFGASAVYAALLAIGVLFALSYAVCQAALTYGVAELLRGRSFGLGRALRAGLSRLGLMFGIGLPFAAIGLGFMLGSTLLGTILPVDIAMLTSLAGDLVVGSLLVSAFFVVLPIAAMEDHNAPGCFARSRFLTRGYRWPIFGLCVLLTLGCGALELLAAIIGQAVLAPQLAPLFPIVGFIGLATLTSIIPAVVYFRLRLLKEGVGLDHIAGVFD